MKNKKVAFTLIELIVAVSILAVGIVVVLQARLSMISALDSASNQIKALQFLDEKMSALEEMAKIDGGIVVNDEVEDVRIGSRRATWKLISSLVVMPVVDVDEEGDDPQKMKEDDKVVARIFEMNMALEWREGRKDKSMTFGVYFPEKVDKEKW